MKPPVSDELRQQVLALRRSQSLRQVAESTGLPLGTVKTICSRSGEFRDNPQHRALFSLPPIRQGAENLPAVPEIPAQRVITGDNEVDAVLWLRECISTGQAALIDLALENAKKIKTPLDELEKRYTAIVRKQNPGNIFATFCTIGFAELEEYAEKSKRKMVLRNEADSRFGETLFDKTDAEQFCVDTLQGIEAGAMGFINEEDAAGRFDRRHDLLPHSLADCLHELEYWNRLGELRHAVDHAADSEQAVYARERFVFSCLGKIRPRSKDEALKVLRWMLADKQNRFNDDQVDGVLPNLIG